MSSQGAVDPCLFPYANSFPNREAIGNLALDQLVQAYNAGAFDVPTQHGLAHARMAMFCFRPVASKLLLASPRREGQFGWDFLHSRHQARRSTAVVFA